MDEQERLARDLAETLAATQETDVTKAMVASWPKWDVYEWLEAWDYIWLVGAWEYAAKEE